MRIIISLLAVFSAFGSYAQSYSKLKVWLDPISIGLLQQRGVEMDHGTIKKDVFIINDFDEATIAWMQSSGIRYEVLIDDVKEFYRTRSATETAVRSSRSACFSATGGDDSIAVPENFTTGSMGGFYTYQEFLDQLDLMNALYPSLISARDSIDTFLTHEGRPIYWVRISDNASIAEAEPQVLYTAIHHAREPQSLTQLVFYMWYLLENYGFDPGITELVDATEMYFVPMLNPDGYIYNEVNDPNGGGMWRKNRRVNGNGVFGVDLNRNYGYEWAYDNQGSSGNPNSDTYRGPSGFSEPETKAISWFCEQHNFGLAMNYHSFGNYLIYPWGFGTQLTPDSVAFIAMAKEMTKNNDYVFGTGMETVGYPVNGDSDDWMYGEQTTKNKIFAMTPEVGAQNDGFWPAQSRIVPLSIENIHPNLATAFMVSDYVAISDASPQLIESTSAIVTGTAERLGLEFNGPYLFSIEPVSASILSVGSAISIASMALAEPEDLQWTIALVGSIEAGETVEYDLVADFAGRQVRERVVKIFGEGTVTLTNEGDMADFLTGGPWGLTDEDYVSPNHSITDSPYGNYQNNQTSELVYNRIVDLRQADFALARFQAKWLIEGGWDYAQILAAEVGTEIWAPLCAKYSVEGNEFQDLGQPVWDGIRNSWVQEEVPLNDYLGKRIKLKFRLVSDPFVVFDGFYFDDLEVVSLLQEGADFPDTGYVDTIGLTPPDTSTGLHQQRQQRWAVFPNPANDYLSVAVAGHANVEVKVFSSSGVLVFASAKTNGLIDVRNWSNGSYIVRLHDVDSGHTEVHRLLIMHGN